MQVEASSDWPNRTQGYFCGGSRVWSHSIASQTSYRIKQHRCLNPSLLSQTCVVQITLLHINPAQENICRVYLSMNNCTNAMLCRSVVQIVIVISSDVSAKYSSKAIFNHIIVKWIVINSPTLVYLKGVVYIVDEEKKGTRDERNKIVKLCFDSFFRKRLDHRKYELFVVCCTTLRKNLLGLKMLV